MSNQVGVIFSLRTKFMVQAFLDFRDFDFRNFRFSAVYNSILFSSPLGFTTTK